MAKEKDFIELQGVRVHNLKNISLKIPKNELVVICGLSGSGKSSLAFDTIYSEGQRRYLESLSAYVRQFLGGFKKPEADKIEGLAPTIAVNQKTISANPRSTVGTITEIHDYLRLLFTYLGKAYCWQCGQAVSAQTPHQIASQVYKLALKNEVLILGPAVSAQKGEHQGTIEEIRKEGWPTIRLDGILQSSEEAKSKTLDKQKKHSLEVLVDRISLVDLSKNSLALEGRTSKKERQAVSRRKKKIKQILKENEERILDSVKKALEIGRGRMMVIYQNKNSLKQEEFSASLSCEKCGLSFPAIEARLFSFNSPFGACPHCQGLGKLSKIDPALIINPNLSLNEGAILPWAHRERIYIRSLNSSRWWFLEEIAKQYNFSLDMPFKDLKKEHQQLVLNGAGEFEGIVPRLERLFHETSSDYVRREIGKYLREIVCPVCQGSRFKKEVLAIRVGEKNIHEVSFLAVNRSLVFFKDLLAKFKPEELKIAQPLIKEINRRLHFLIDVGLEYIDLAREAGSLSVGENQRIRLACQLGSGLSGVVYVLDEPTIGLHQRDIARLNKALRELVLQKNTVIVVEHDQRVIESADWIIEIGPAAGRFGGKVVFEGRYKQLLKAKTLTGQYLSGKKKVKSPYPIKDVDKENKWLELRGASQFNLKKVDLKIPLSRFVCVAGVSGSGKSTLIIETLAKALLKEISGQSRVNPGQYQQLNGQEYLNKMILVDQSPIGRTPRSNPATYTNLFTPIRQLFSQTRAARLRGYHQSHFSFNTRAGQCPACRGEGSKKVEMYFLPDVYVECELCQGKRYTPEVLKATYNNKNIAEVLEMSVEEAKKFFSAIPQVRDKLQLLEDIGLGYLKLGQSSTTLSGGESQRIKLAHELSKRDTGRTLYILDEPTVGLHFEDIKKLLVVLRRLVEKENTVVVIEHNPEVLEEADWIVELGPEGGDRGGRIVFEGTAGQLKKAKTWTGKFLI